MGSTVTTASADRHLDRLEALRPQMAKAVQKIEIRREQVGQLVARCFELAHLTQKEAAALLDRDQAQVARWCNGQERAQFDALLGVPVLAKWLPVAVAESVGEDVEVMMTVTVRRTA